MSPERCDREASQVSGAYARRSSLVARRRRPSSGASGGVLGPLFLASFVFFSASIVGGPSSILALVLARLEIDNRGRVGSVCGSKMEDLRPAL